MLYKLSTYPAIALLKGVSKLPFPILYFLSDILFIFVYHSFRYRRKVVDRNIHHSFPEYSDRQRKITARRFYRYLCDLMVEILKTRSLTPEEIHHRMVIRNPEVVNSYFEKGRSIIVLTMHYGNWEWLCGMPLVLRHHHFAVFKPQQNSSFEDYLNSVRSRFGIELISMSVTLRKLLEAEKAGKPVLTGLLADQSPPWNHPFWTTFMNQPAMFFNGPAKLAHRFNQPVVFQQVRRIKRGYYETWFEVLFDNPREADEETIINAYVAKAESVIREAPEYYLWSHRRWKYPNPGANPVY